MKANVYSLDGNVLKQIELPHVFQAPYREDLVKRAVLSDESREYQPKGSYKFAGLETSAKYVGRKEVYGSRKNKGIAHLPREVLPKGQFGRVKRVPHAVKGRRAHPPKVEKKLIEEINQKEYKKALISALSGSANLEMVRKNYVLPSGFSVPVVVDNAFEKLKKTNDVIKFFEVLKLGDLVDKSKSNGTEAVIVANGDILKAANNLPTVSVVSPEKLKVKHLAPGTHGGRLLILSESGLIKIVEMLAK